MRAVAEGSVEARGRGRQRGPARWTLAIVLSSITATTPTRRKVAPAAAPPHLAQQELRLRVAALGKLPQRVDGRETADAAQHHPAVK